MDYPTWVTRPNLGTFTQSYSFDLNPIVLSFSADSGATVSLINGLLPAGLIWSKLNNTVVISGAITTPSTELLTVQFSFRITQLNGGISDRTFSLKLTPIAIVPSWENQNPFLGYQGNVVAESYQLQSTPPPGDHVIYELLTPITGMTINSATGLLTYNAATETSNIIKSFEVKSTATNSLTTNSIDLTLSVVISPLAPKWTTAPGALENSQGGFNFPGNEFIEIQLEAEDVTGAVVVYEFVSTPVDFPLSLSPAGLLYGLPQNPLAEISYAFSVKASSSNGSSIQSFTISIIPLEIYSLLSWESEEDLGTINEGTNVELYIRANTQRQSVILYYVTGGLLPPHLMLQPTTGKLVGFCEYHAIDKEYFFDITITDGFQTKTKKFKISVKKLYSGQFFGAYIPVTGIQRESFAASASNVSAREPGTVIVNRINDIVDPPYLNIINGVVTGYATPDELAIEAEPWLHTLDLQFGKSANTQVLSGNVGVLYRNIGDRQFGANSSVYSTAVYNTNAATNGNVYPTSIDNMRQALLGNRLFVGSGGGYDSNLLPIIDWSTGELISVEIVSPGIGYHSRPSINVTGSGTGAAVRALIGVVSVDMIDSGQGWQVGDVIQIPGHVDTAPALLEITEIDSNGAIIKFDIENVGDYFQVSAAPSIVITNDAAIATIKPNWGIVAVTIVSRGNDYQCEISLKIDGEELLPPWQSHYFPAIEIGNIPIIVANHAADLLNENPETVWGKPWLPPYMVFQWQGITWYGTSTFDSELTTFDGGTTRFQETEDPSVTIFDQTMTTFDQTIFDYDDPLAYDLFQVWGGTLVDQGNTVFDLYTTVFDVLGPRKYSNTLVRKWIGLQHKIYSGNNAVW